MKNNVSEFGKEVGLLHEVAITGRKVGADVTTYSFLASNEIWFGRFSDLSRQLSAVVKYNVPVATVDIGSVEKLIQDITVIAGCCLTCGIANGEHRERALSLLLPPEAVEAHKNEMAQAGNQEARDSISQAFHEKLYGIFYEWLERRIREVGLHPSEVSEFFPQYHYDDHRPWGSHSNKGWLVSKHECSSPEHLTDAILKVARQRNVLGVLEKL